MTEGQLNVTLNLIDKMSNTLNTVMNKSKELDDVIDKLNNKQLNPPVPSNPMDSLLSKAKKLIPVVGVAFGAKQLINMSDKITNINTGLTRLSNTYASVGKGSTGIDDMKDKIQSAAKNSMGSFEDMADMVGKLGNNAMDSFSNTDEVIKFSEMIQKQFTLAGTDTATASNAMVQLTQAMGSGVLRGDELNSVFESCPLIIQNLAKGMGVSVGEIKNMAAQGKITSDVIKNIMLNPDIMAGVDEQMKNVTPTFQSVMKNLSGDMLRAMEEPLKHINGILQNSGVQNLLATLPGLIANIGVYAVPIIDGTGVAIGGLCDIINFLIQHMDMIMLFLPPLAFAFGAVAITTQLANKAGWIYNGTLGATKIATGLVAFATKAYNIALQVLTGQLSLAGAAQKILNAAMKSNPIIIVITAILALISVIVALVHHFRSAGDEGATVVGTIAGCFYALIEVFKIVVDAIICLFGNMWTVISNLAENLSIVFKNPIESAKSIFYGLMSTACEVVAKIAEMLNKLPFVHIDTDGLMQKAEEYKAEQTVKFKGLMDGVDFSKIGNAGDRVAKAFDKGAKKFDAMFAKKEKEESKLPDIPQMPVDIGGGGAVGANTGKTAKNTGDMAKSLSESEEQLKYLRDVAEQEYINRFTTAEIKVQMTNNNNINGNMDIDTITDSLSRKINEAMLLCAEGV